MSLTARILILIAVICYTGCAEGPLWKTGKYAPWAQKQWAEEEQIANTLFARKKAMKQSTESVIGAPVEQQQQVAEQLAEVLYRDPILLLRLEAIHLLGQLNCPAANEALSNASRDHNSDIRIAAINVFKSMPADRAVPQLQELIGGDSNVDVRLAATRALGDFAGESSVRALALALQDSDPALQLRAAESLQRVTGQSFGKDIVAWQGYVKNYLPDNTVIPGSSPTENAFGSGSQTRTANEGSSIFR